MAGALSPILGGKVLIGSWQSTGVQIVVHAHRSVWQPRQPERSKVPLRRTRAVRASFLPTNHRYMRERAGNGFSPSPSFLMSRRPRRPLFVPGSAEARVAVKAARFRTAFVQLRACGVLWTACEAALARLGRPLSPAEQRTIVDATRTPYKVKWPEWWSERP